MTDLRMYFMYVIVEGQTAADFYALRKHTYIILTPLNPTFV